MTNIPLYPISHDPSDVADYNVDFADALNGQTLTAVTVTVDSVAAAAGVTIGTGSFAPSVVGTAATFWLSVTTPNNAAFNAGVQAVITLRATVSGSPARIFERSVQVLVRHSDRPSVQHFHPVTIAEAKTHLRVDTVDDDLLIGSLINAAAMAVEAETGIICAARSITVYFRSFSDRLALHYLPINSITAITYLDTDGATQTLASNQYRLGYFAGVAVINPANGVSYPATDTVDGAVAVTFNAGHASNAAIDARIKQAALLMVGHWYANREAVNIGNITSDVPMTVRYLLAGLRLAFVA
jgi:uncharacterized phiE125 gp8 family phage protein